ncbi:D-alanyl-D-alanine carboxypeptidase family protein [Amycolatopsis granulosa]|uniref:D-alanyl-D-alanine carboxypeptidase family protein n=1 Tax=Amycolatopsis granulosa TaxID=185684 RepID=UPI00141E7F3B|nr:D-alanyl-D-alanine carboxypeptidase (penicillin-binding protein 5/6) [Amycolatopsis granulosa]
MRRGLLLSLVLVVLSGLVPFAGTAAAAPAVCPDRTAPPPPVDTSEQPQPGVPAPAPLPVPTAPVGGARMGECGVIYPSGAAVPPETTAASWVLQDLDTGDVLAAKNPHARERPASLIKTLLALVVIRELKPDQVLVPTAEDASQECTCVGLVAGGRYTVDLLLHGLLMHSGNDVAHTFATALGGVPATVQKMNRLAASLGASDTRTATPSGLDGPGMSASAYDLSLIFNYAMKQPEFAAAIATRATQIPDQPGKPAFSIVNDNKLLGTYPGFLGGKTGFTDDARHTYVGGAEQNGRRVAVVMMRAEQRPAPVVNQARALLDYGFTLARTKTAPVGHLVSPMVSEETENGGTSGVTGATAGAKDPFGVTGWILTVVVALIIVAGFVIGHYRKKAHGPQN